MAWDSLDLPITGTPITSAWGATVRGDLNETAAAKISTAGDLVYGTGPNALARLGIGPGGYVLTVVAGVPAWSTAAHAHNAVDITAGTLPAARLTGIEPDFSAVRVGGYDGLGVAGSVVTVGAGTSGGTDPTEVRLSAGSGGRIGLLLGGTIKAFVGASGGFHVGNYGMTEHGDNTLTVAGDVYKNATAYANPGFVFEHAFTGKIEQFAENDGAADYPGRLPLEDAEAYAREHLELPGIRRRNLASGDRGVPIFARGDALLEVVEEAFLYIFELQRRLKALEDAQA